MLIVYRHLLQFYEARKEGRLEAYQYLDKGKLIIRGKNKGEWYWDYFKDWEN